MNTIYIRFQGEGNREKGIGILFRSEYSYDGLDKNLFRVSESTLKLLDNADVGYEILGKSCI